MRDCVVVYPLNIHFQRLAECRTAGALVLLGVIEHNWGTAGAVFQVRHLVGRALCGSKKYPYPPTEESLICTLHCPRFSVPGGLCPPHNPPPPTSPHEFPEFLNRNFAYHPLEIQSGFWTKKQRKCILTQLRKYGRIR